MSNLLLGKQLPSQSIGNKFPREISSGMACCVQSHFRDLIAMPYRLLHQVNKIIEIRYKRFAHMAFVHLDHLDSATNPSRR